MLLFLSHYGTAPVITCPAYFKDPQRQATKEAGMLAGINVLRIVNEPTAAAFAYGLAQGDESEERLAMVYDLGGGTFDVTVIKMMGGNLEVIGTGGDPELGGGNFDDRIVDWMMEKLEQIEGYSSTLSDEKRKVLRLRLKSYAEDAKKALCGPPPADKYQFQIAQVDKFEGKPVVFNEILTMEEFEDRIRDLLENSMRWLDEAMKIPTSEKYNYTEDHITDILLVGGSTRVPLVRKMLEDRYPKTPIRGVESGINPDEIVARGAALVAAEADPDSDETVTTDYVDVTGHTLSVAVAADATASREVLQPLVPKETPIPVKASHIFSSMGEFQEACRVKVYQGEGREIEGNDEVTMIGEFIIQIDPIKDPIHIEIGLDLDENGLLIAHATNQVTGAQVKCEINYEDSAQMTPQQLRESQAQLAVQMERGVGRTQNPLDEAGDGTAQPSTGWARPQAPSQPLETASSSPAQPAAPPNSTDPTSVMNPIVRALYTKAINSFARIPADRQNSVMQLVSEMEQAAMAGDQQKLLTCHASLSRLLEGVK